MGVIKGIIQSNKYIDLINVWCVTMRKKAAQ